MKPSEVRPHPHRLPPPTLPGEVLEEEWLKPRGMSQTALAEKMGLRRPYGNHATTAAALNDRAPIFPMNLSGEGGIRNRSEAEV